MKLSTGRIEEGVITGLIIAAVVGLCIAAYRSWLLSTPQHSQN